MKRTVTVTFEFDDDPWFDPDSGEYFPTDVIGSAMDAVNGILPIVGNEFVDVKLDDKVLVDRNGYVSEEVKKRDDQHQAFMENVERWLLKHRKSVC